MKGQRRNCRYSQFIHRHPIDLVLGECVMCRWAVWVSEHLNMHASFCIHEYMFSFASVFCVSMAVSKTFCEASISRIIHFAIHLKGCFDYFLCSD